MVAKAEKNKAGRDSDPTGLYMPYCTGETMAIWTPLDSISSNLRVGDLLMEQDLTWQATVAGVSVRSWGDCAKK